MKAIVYTQYGGPDVLHLTDIPQPTPKDDEVLVRVHATTVGYGEVVARDFGHLSAHEFNMPFILWLMSRIIMGLRTPKNAVLGSAFAGTVAKVGANVTTFKVGDAVFGYRGQGMGCYVEYLCMPAQGIIAQKPRNMSDAEAATVPYGALTALTLLRRLSIQPGQRVLINGASGSIGSWAVQFAKHAGAEVTGVCGPARAAFVKALGADHVIDYTQTDFTRNGQRYALIIDILGRSSFEQCRQSLTPQGVYAPVSFKMKAVLQAIWTARSQGQRVQIGFSDEKPADLQTIQAMIEAGELKGLPIDGRYPLERAGDAHRYYESPDRTGTVVITVD